jgi:hypothetical protein
MRLLSLGVEPPAAPLAVSLVREYLVAREREGWFIDFDGERFGPYISEREALLFAIDAAHALGLKGEPTREPTRVLSRDETGGRHIAWTYGQDPYPSGL